MIYFLAAGLLTLLVLFFILGIRSKDLPDIPAEPPYKHLETRKAQIYENLRDLNFEFRVGKLSDTDYQRTKVELQTELAKVLQEIDRLKGAPTAVKTSKTASKGAADASVRVCPHCGAKFDRPLKFCGECGKPMTAAGGVA